MHERRPTGLRVLQVQSRVWLPNLIRFVQKIQGKTKAFDETFVVGKPGLSFREITTNDTRVVKLLRSGCRQDKNNEARRMAAKANANVYMENLETGTNEDEKLNQVGYTKGESLQLGLYEERILADIR